MNTHQRHRPGNLKQVNKPHRTKFATKGQLKKEAKGRLGSQSRTHIKKTVILSKEERRKRAKQIQKNKREKLLEQKRIGTSGPPKIVVLLPLAQNVDTSQVKKYILESQSIEMPNTNGPMTIAFKDFKQRVTIVEAKRNIRGIMDAGKIADVLLCVIPPTGMDKEGEFNLSLIRSQGLPPVICVVQGLSQISEKKQKEFKKQITKKAQHEFPEDTRIVYVDSVNDGKQLCRWIHEQRTKTISWRDIRPYMLVDKWNFIPNQNVTNPSNGTLVVYGYLRGKPLSANKLVQLVNYGTYQIEKICKEEDPCQPQHKKRKDTEMMEDNKEPMVLQLPDERQESLQSEIIPDPMANEQTWPTKEDFQKAKKEAKKEDYISSWIVDEEGEEGEGEEDDEVMDEEDEIIDDTLPEDAEDARMEVKSEIQSQLDEHFNIEDDEQMDEMEREEQRLRFQKMVEESKEDEENPDEVDTPLDVPARIRFQKYRGLKSFRSSPWDPKENLPLEYARIFEFENYNRSRRIALNEVDEGAVDPDIYISIYIKDVPISFTQKHDPTDLLQVFGLLKHEQKTTLMHFWIKKRPEFTKPIKSKTELIAQIGFRTYKCNPIFSTPNPHFEKQKFLKYLHHGGLVCASMYVPMTWSPCPVFFFQKNEETGALELVATGSVKNSDTNKIILKKIVLTGQPFKVHKRQGIVRFMFYNPDDVRWFKPVELWTKLGRHGLIREPLGTHGYMKCTFDGVVYSHDTVCMSLYKRVFPKWTTEFLSLLN